MPKKVLIVEDNEDNRELVVKVLRNKGYEIVQAADGEEALEKAVAERPDLILLDISLPKLDGYEIPIIAFTAHAMKGDREKVIVAGFEGYISKPINVRELPDQVKSFIRGKRESILGGEET
jgi:two-component system cell cycle response regulator DivK